MEKNEVLVYWVNDTQLYIKADGNEEKITVEEAMIKYGNNNEVLLKIDTLMEVGQKNFSSPTTPMKPTQPASTPTTIPVPTTPMKPTQPVSTPTTIPVPTTPTTIPVPITPTQPVTAPTTIPQNAFKVSIQQIGKATINTPTEAKEEAKAVESEIDTRETIQEKE